jgi:hypothetical protein
MALLGRNPQGYDGKSVGMLEGGGLWVGLYIQKNLADMMVGKAFW